MEIFFRRMIRDLQHDFYQVQQIDYELPRRHLNQMNDDLQELKRNIDKIFFNGL
jgi:hypothetical protein